LVDNILLRSWKRNANACGVISA